MRELDGGALGVAFEGIGRGERSVDAGVRWSSAARFFEPEDGLVRPRT